MGAGYSFLHLICFAGPFPIFDDPAFNADIREFPVYGFNYQTINDPLLTSLGCATAAVLILIANLNDVPFQIRNGRS